jgi:photosystem II stability/assembly factor-like uncharacterized protein
MQGDDLYAAGFKNTAGGADNTHPDLIRSTDGGSTWRRFADPCTDGPERDGGNPMENDAAELAAAPGGFLSILCSSRLASNRIRPYLLNSSDSGATFGGRHPMPHVSANSLAAGSATVLASLGLVGSDSVVFISRDSGETWTIGLRVKSAPAEGSVYLGFQDEGTARAAFGTSDLWTTYDAGLSWTRSSPFAA